MIIALTGTPGTGKTTVCSIIRNHPQYGKLYSIIDLNELVLNEKLYAGKDEARDSFDVDLEELQERVKPMISELKDGDVIMEGHLSHFLPADAIIVLRAHPIALKRRLGERKDYSFKKVKENADAEALDVILVESCEMSDKVFEIDTTEATVLAVTETVISIIESLKEGKNPDELLPGKIDWICHAEID